LRDARSVCRGLRSGGVDRRRVLELEHVEEDSELDGCIRDVEPER
jgi:hypothetical protein